MYCFLHFLILLLLFFFLTNGKKIYVTVVEITLSLLGLLIASFDSGYLKILVSSITFIFMTFHQHSLGRNGEKRGRYA